MSIISITKSLIQSPGFSDNEKNRIAGVLNIISIAAILGLFMLLLFRIIAGDYKLIISMLIILAIMFICRFMIFRGFVDISGKIILWTLLGFIIYLMLRLDGFHDSSVMAVPGVLVISGLILKRNYFYFFSAAALFSIILFGNLEIFKVLNNNLSHLTSFSQILDITIILIITTFTIRILSDGMINNLNRARENEMEIKKQAESLKEISERYKTMFESANDAILIMNRDKFIDCNNTAVKMFGYAKNKIIGESPVYFSPPVQSDGIDSKIKAIEKIDNALIGNPQRFEWQHINAEGKLFDTEVSLVKIEISGQIFLHAIVRDITERKKAEEDLKLSEQKLRTLFNLAADPILLLEFDGKIIDSNQAAHKLIGLDKKQFQNINIIDLNTEENKSKVKDRLSIIKRTGKHVFDTELVSKYGKSVPIEVNAVTIEYEKRNVILAIHRDLTIRLKAEKILKDSEEKYRNIVQTALEGFCILDINGKVLEVNNAFCNILEYSGSELTGLNLSDMEINENPEKIKQHLQAIINKGYDRFETQLRNKLGNNLFVDVSITFSKSNQIYFCFLSDITDQKKSDGEILKNQLFINRITEQSPDIIYIYDVLKDVNIFTNKNIGKMLGYDDNEFPVYNREFFQKVIHPDDIIQFNKFYETINKWETEFIFEYEYRMKDKNGDWRWFTGKEKEFQRSSEGKIISLIGTVSEFTEKKKFEEALIESEQRYKLLSDMAVEGIALQSQGFLYDANETFLEMVGYKREELIGRDVIPIIFPKDQIENARQLNKVERDNPLEFKYITSKGIERIAEFRYKNTEYKGHKVRFTSVYDITERKIFEKKLQESEEKFRRLFQTSPNIIVISVVESGLIIDVNDVGARILGFEKEEMIGKTSIELGVAKYETREEMKKIILKEKEFNLLEQTLYKKSGEPITCLLSGQLLNIEDRTYLFQTIVDITKLKHSEEKLMVYQQNLKILASELNLAEERERRRIAINLHDHLTQSLAMTKIKLAGIQKEILSDEIKKNLKEANSFLNESIQNSRKITNELSPPVLYELGLTEAIEWLLKRVEANSKIKTIYKSELGEIYIDNDERILLFRSINELLNNSIKHSGCTTISVYLRKKVDNIFAQVKDNGIGFEPQKVANKNPGEGGFGLFSIKERLEYLNGSIIISSSPGKGTDIILSLTLKKASFRKE